MARRTPTTRPACSRPAAALLSDATAPTFPNIAPRLGVEMPSVGSGGYSEMTVSTKLPAGPVAKGGNATDTAGALTAVNANPRRVSARMTVTLEDVAAIGQANFESALRQNVSMSLSDAIDNQIINGDGSSPNINGILNQLTAVAAGAAVATFDDFVTLVAGRVEGLWASTTKDVSMVVNPRRTGSPPRRSGGRRPTADRS